MTVFEILAVCGLLFVIGFVLTECVVSRLAVQLQLYRCFYLLYYLVTIYAANLLCAWSDATLENVFPRTKRIQSAAGVHTPPPASEDRRRVPTIFVVAIGMAITTGLLLTRRAHVGGIALLLILLPAFRSGSMKRQRDNMILLGTGALLFAYVVWKMESVLIPREFFLLAAALGTALLYVAAIRRDSAGRWSWISIPVLLVGASLAGQLCGIYSIGGRSAFRYLVQLPGSKSEDPWADVSYWCEANTKKDSMFIVPPGSHYFRIFSKRSTVGCGKDGAKVMFSEAFASAWYERMIDLSDYDTMSEAKCRKLAEKYGASHIVTVTDRQLRFPKIYENESFIVYEIRAD